jgi:hypothetical protein
MKDNLLWDDYFFLQNKGDKVEEPFIKVGRQKFALFYDFTVNFHHKIVAQTA